MWNLVGNLIFLCSTKNLKITFSPEPHSMCKYFKNILRIFSWEQRNKFSLLPLPLKDGHIVHWDHVDHWGHQWTSENIIHYCNIIRTILAERVQNLKSTCGPVVSHYHYKSSCRSVEIATKQPECKTERDNYIDVDTNQYANRLVLKYRCRQISEYSRIKILPRTNI